MSKIGSLYRAEYEFKPEAPSELGLQSGDLVRILDDKSVNKGWILVAREGNEDDAGYVPVAYITPVEEDNRAAAAPGPSPIAAEEGKHQAFETNRSSEAKEKPKPSPLTSAREEEVPDYGYESRDFPGFGGYEASSALNGSYDRSTAMNAYTSEADETLAIARANAFASRDPEIMDFEPASITNDDFAALFSSHEEWFQQAAARRRDAFSELQGAITDLGRRVRDSENRSANMVQTLSELEHLIDDERVKWQSRMDQESIIGKTSETSELPDLSRLFGSDKPRAEREMDGSRA